MLAVEKAEGSKGCPEVKADKAAKGSRGKKPLKEAEKGCEEACYEDRVEQ